MAVQQGHRVRPFAFGSVIAATLMAATAARSGCQGKPSASARPAARDSAGVRIVGNPARGAMTPNYQLESKATLSIGGLEEPPAPELNSRNGYITALVDAAGLVVADGSRVQFFDAQGRRRRVVGREGRGPGEYLTITALCRTRGDSLLAVDPNNRRFSVLDRDGEFGRSASIAEFGSVYQDFCFRDGTIVAAKFEVGAGSAAPRYALARVSPSGALVNRLVDIEAGPADPATRRRTMVAGSADRLLVGTALRPEVLVYRQSGPLAMIVRTDDAMASIKGRDADERLLNSTPINISQSERAARLERLRPMRTEMFWPSFDRLLAEESGAFWIRDFQLSAQGPQYWTRFDELGRITHRLRVNVDLLAAPDVLRLEPQSALLRWRDTDGAVHFAIYRIKRI